MLARGSGTLEAVSYLDGVDRLYAFQKVGAQPLLLSVSYGIDAVFAGWWHRAVLVVAGMTVLLLMAGALLFALRRQLIFRTAAEHHALRLAEIANRSEATLASSLVRLDAVLQHSADIHFAASRRADGRFAFDLLNRRGEEVTGLLASAVIGKTLDEVLEAKSSRLLQSNWDFCLQTGEPYTYSLSLELPTGLRHWETRLVPVLDTRGEVTRLIGTSRDVTQRKLAEEGLIRLNDTLERRAEDAVAAQDDALRRASAAERLQLLGQLASGIAHDVSNVLQSVSGCAELIDRRAEEPHTMRRVARLIADATERGASITRRLLAFSRGDATPYAHVSVGPVFENLAEIMRHTLRAGAHLDIRIQIEGEALTVFAERNHLETVLLNLATNARDAMPEGGTITLGAAATFAPPPGLRQESYVQLWVKDDGVGMDEATLARVKEPFFTTKPPGQGTGLGLSMADTFARDAGGALTIESHPGLGTTVSLWLSC